MGFKANTNKNQSTENSWGNSNKSVNETGSSSTNSSTVGNTATNASNTAQQNDVLRSLTNSTNSTLNQTTGRTNASFSSPEAQTLLASLTGRLTSSPDYSAQAGSTYGRLAQGGVDPNVEGIIAASDAEASKNFASRLAQTRAGAYRGGTAANIGKQGQLAADFSAQQAGNNAKTRSDAYNNSNTMALAGASGLGGLASSQQGLGAQLLSLLRGEETSGLASGQQVGSTATNQTNQSNNTSNQAANTATNSNTSTQTTQQMLQTILEALSGGKSGTQTGSSAGSWWGS